MALTSLDRARRIRLILLDVDGVLTDGKIQVHADGTESKQFDGRSTARLRPSYETRRQS